MSAIEDSGDSRCPEESNAQESMMSTISLGQLTPHDYDLQQSNLALLKAELKLVTRDRDILQKELNRVQQHQPSSLSGPPLSASSYRPPVIAGTLPRRLPSGQGISSIDRSPSTSSVRDYEQMQTHSEAAARAMKESEYYQRQHRQAMTKLDSTNQEMDSLRAKYMDLLAGKQRLEQEIHILSQAREEDRKEINELRRQQQEMAIKGSGTSETLNQPYLNTLRKYEAIKDEHDSLRKRYTDLVASHSAAVSKLELAQEEMTRLKKQYEEAIQERNAVTRESNFLKQQCTHAIMQWDNAIRERNTYKDILTKMQAQHDEEVGKVMEIHMKASKDLKRLTDERNAAMEEYSLVMRERDTVHKEIEKLQDDLQQANKRIKLLETKNKELSEEKEVVVYQTESLRREILSALHDRDTALKELNDLREKYGDYKKDQRGDNSLLTRKTDYEGLTCVSDSLRKERGFEAPKSGRGESYSMDLGDQQEVEQLRKLVEKLHGELQEALQEAEVSKRRRDWAFGERDKVVLERESIRTLCDRLRRERDRAVSELAEALRDSDDIKRQRNEASKELKELKEKFGELQMEKDKEKEKDARPPHNHSYDSALGTDVSDAETETVEVEIDFATSIDDLGFSLAGGRSNPVCANDSALYVVSISRGGPAEGKLRVSDCLVKVGNVSCATADSETAYNIIRTSKSPVVLTLKRRRSQSQGLYSVKLNVFGGVQHGLILENGIYIKSVVSGSIAARETTLKSGDRLCSINGRSTESFSGLDEVCRVLDELYHTEGLVITVVRGSSFPGMYPLSLPSLGSPSSSSSAHNITEDDNGDSQYSSSNLRLRASPRSDVTAAKSSKSSTSHRFNGSSNGGFGPWDMIRDRFTRIRRPHSKERVEHETSESKRSSVANTGASTEREAAIAELESVIDKYNQQLEMNSDRESIKNASSKPDFFTLNRRSRVTVSQKAPNKREEVVISSGGTWPRCRAGSPLTSAYLQSGTMFNQKYSRGRPTLSIFSTDLKSSKEHVPEDSAFNRRSENVHESKYHVYEGCNPEAGCLGSTHAPSDTSIDFSVKSGNMGKDVLEYYVKKKNPNSGKNDLDGGGRVSQASVSVSESAAPASGLSSPVHVHSSMPAPSHLRIHSQLYGCPNTIHSSIKYKLPHVHHPHNPPRYSSPPPLARPPSETYESPYMAPLSAKSSYSHAPSPSIDSVYSRPTLVPSHTHAPSFRVSDDLTANRVPRSDCVHLPFDSLNSVKRDPPRIRIPSNQSVTSRSSIEKLSERGSPMPNFHVEVLSPGRGGGDNRNSLSEYYSSGALKFKPALGELRRIYIEKSSKPLGIQIFCRNSGGVFVSSVHQPSLAAQVGLQVGDQLLEVCGINMRSATYQLAASVLRQCGDSVTMLVQYNLAKYQELTSSGFMGSPLMTSSGSEGDNSGQNDRCHRSRSGTPTPCNSPSPSRNNSTSGKDDVIDSASSTLRNPLHLDLLVERNSEARSSLVRPPSIHGTLTRHHALSSLKRPTSVVSPSNAEDSREPRLVLLDMKSSHNLGISLVGGNAFGIFVHAVQPDSSAHQAGLRCGDRILEFNGVNLRDATAEQAAYELAKPAEKVTLVVQHDIERYHEIAEQPGDSFYVRAQFDKPAGERADPMELYFRRDDILFIDNTMFNGVPGLWRAWLVDQEGRKIRCGVIPSKFKIEEEILQRSSLGDLDHDSRRSSTSARRSFFRRRKHNRSSSRDSKELASFSDASLQMGSAEGLGLGLICMQENSPQRPLSYVIVDRMDCHNIRPVLLVGPLADCVVDKLVQDFPRKFVRVAAEVMRVPQSYMEKGLEENVFVEYRRRGSHFECVTAAAVQEVCDKNVHGVLDISMNAVERLHSLRVYPIVLLLKFKSVKHVREVKDTRLLSDKMAAKAAKEMYEHVIKVEAEHRHLVSSVVQAGGNLACICTQVATAVDQEQNKILWVPRVSTW